MKFLRRPDLDPKMRLNMALAMLERNSSDWGIVTELAEKYNVSREFLYDNVRRILASLQVEIPPETTGLSQDEFTKLILCLRLCCHSSLAGIRQLCKEMGWTGGSTGRVSQLLAGLAANCELELPELRQPSTVLLDEIYCQGCPILVVMEALSHHIYAILLADDRYASTWKQLIQSLFRAGLDINLAVKDQGTCLKSAIQALGIPERADLFHLLKPFDPFLAHMERRAYGAIQHEHEQLLVLKNRTTCKGRLKWTERYYQSCLKSIPAIQRCDDYEFLHKCLHEVFCSFTSSGRKRSRSEAEGDLEATLTLMEEEFADHTVMMSAIKTLRRNVVDFWSYFDDLEKVIADYSPRLPPTILQATCLFWQLSRQAMAVKSPARKKILTVEAAAQNAILEGFSRAPAMKYVTALLKALDTNVRSSSPLEAINSVIRTTLNACRGQITQNTLNMLAFFWNHQVATRGKYAGTSPYERLTGIRESASAIDKILARSGALPNNMPSGQVSDFVQEELREVA